MPKVIKILVLSLSFSTFWASAGRCETWQSSNLPYSTPVIQTPPPSQAFAGLNLFLGQSRSTNGTAPRPAYGIGAELGYTYATSLWSRLEPSLSLSSHSLGFGSAELSLPYSVLAKLGYGYSVGKGLFALWKLGVGAGLVSYRDEVSGVSRSATKKQMSTIAQGAFLLDMPLGADFTLVSGLQWTYYAFHLEALRTETAELVDVQAPVLVNSMEVSIGLRRLL